MLQWPFVGRSRELQRALEVLEKPSAYHGVVLVGEAGVGKTALARCLADALGSTGRAERFIFGTKTARAIPLAAFQNWVPVEEPREPAVLLAAAHRALAAEKDLLMVVDDAHLLDQLSAVLVHQVAASGTTKLIVTIRSGDEIPDAVTALWKEHHLLRIDIKPFTHAQTGELVCAVLDGVVPDSVIDRLHDLSAGVALVVRGLLTTAIENGTLVDGGGQWRLTSALQVGADLNDLFESCYSGHGRRRVRGRRNPCHCRGAGLGHTASFVRHGRRWPRRAPGSDSAGSRWLAHDSSDRTPASG